MSQLMNLGITIAFILGLAFNLVDTTADNAHLHTPNILNQQTIDFSIDSMVVYQSSNLIIKKLSDHIYLHVSYLNTDDFGKVGCNGMIVISDNEGVIFDTPTDNQSSKELIQFITQQLKSEIIALIPTHFHQDCVGGIEEFEAYNIPTFASKETLSLLTQNGQIFSSLVKSFTRKFTLSVGTQRIYAEYFGQGHTSDNIIGYFPLEEVVFGGCLIKEIGAGKGNLNDANIDQWSKTVEKVKSKYPDVKLVIPGHGQIGGRDLLDYTINLFEK